MVDIYAAREQNSYGVSSALLAERIGGNAVYAESLEAAANILECELKNGDTAVVMGAGDVYKIFGHMTFSEDRR
ncbi:MAG: hypothetical protein J6U86_00205 [Clostridia bacterium]|nr:hypothetical protein [Clostridia bacterium]